MRILIVDAALAEGCPLPRGAVLFEADVPEARVRRAAEALAAGEETGSRNPYVGEAARVVARRLGDERLCAADVARRLRVSPAHLSRVFRRETGVTLAAYIAARRMERAAALLTGGCARVYEVAAAVGYRDVDSFSAAFRRAYGVCPGAYRDAGGEAAQSPNQN